MLVLEAADRVGGRARTVYSSSGDYLFEAGAAWLHGGKENPLAKVAASHGIDLIPASNWRSVQTYDKGRMLSGSKRSKYSSQFEDLLYSVHQEKNLYGPKTSLRQALLKKSKMDRKVLEHFIKVNIEDDFGASSALISLRDSNDEHSFKGNDYLVKGGYSRLAAAYAQGLAVMTQTKVSKVERIKGGCRVECDNGAPSKPVRSW